MHTKLLLPIGTALTFLLANLLWWLKFGGDFSARQQDWASFGTYIGGVVSPIIASLSLFALLKTLDKQQEQIRQAQDHANLSQIESALAKLESDYREALSLYPLSIKQEGKEETFQSNGFDILNEPSGAVWDRLPDKPELEGQLKVARPYDQPVIIYTMFGQAGGALNQIRIYVQEHEKVSGGNILAKYYHRKYKPHHARLYGKGFVGHPWPAPE